jgi:hypothetical protein
MADEKQPTDAPKKKTGLFKYLDNTIGDDGLRTDVKITLTNDTAVKIVAVALISTVLSSVAFFMIKAMFQPKTTAVKYNPPHSLS